MLLCGYWSFWFGGGKQIKIVTYIFIRKTAREKMSTFEEGKAGSGPLSTFPSWVTWGSRGSQRRCKIFSKLGKWWAKLLETLPPVLLPTAQGRLYPEVSWGAAASWGGFAEFSHPFLPCLCSWGCDWTPSGLGEEGCSVNLQDWTSPSNTFLLT